MYFDICLIKVVVPLSGAPIWKTSSILSDLKTELNLQISQSSSGLVYEITLFTQTQPKSNFERLSAEVL